MEQVQVVFPQFDRTIVARRGDNLLALMQQHAILLEADCGGVACCQRCRVLINDEPQLACMTNLMTDVSVVVPSAQPEEDFLI